MKHLLAYLAIAITALAGCAATTGVVSMSPGVYSVSHRDNGPMASLGAIRAQAYQDAAAFCAGQKKAPTIIKTNEVPRSLGQFPEVEVQFTCS